MSIRPQLLATVAALAIVLGASFAQAEEIITREVTVSPVRTTTTTIVNPAPVRSTTTTTITTPGVAVPVAAPGSTVTTTTTTKSTKAWSTTEKPLYPNGTQVLNLIEFDLNGDGILTRREAGDRLFRLYDTDGNMVIDNNEYERAAVFTVTPVEKKTVLSYDLDGDGLADRTQISSEVFLRESMLARFDGNGNGLSPREFTNRPFLVADLNNDKQILQEEWIASYDAALDKTLKAEGALNK